MINQPPIRRHDLWPHQLQAYDACIINRDRCMLAMDMGTGKSKVVIDRIQNSDLKDVLILCPVSVRGVWRREIDKHWALPKKPIVTVLEKGTCQQKAQLFREDSARAEQQELTHIVVVNYESAAYGTKRGGKPLGDVLQKALWSLIVCDESHRIKAPHGKASKFVADLSRRTPRRLCLTGTPMPHSPLDLFGQYRFLDASIFGRSYVRFRARYAVCSQQFPSQVRYWINEEELAEKFGSLAYQCKASDVLDLPEITHNYRTCEMSPAAAKAYRGLEKHLIADVETGTVTVANALVQLLRMQQITSGFVSYDDDDGAETFERFDDNKEKLLADMLEDINRPAVVFCRFREDLRAVKRASEKLGRRYGELSGEQKDLTEHAQMLPETQVMGVQIQSGGVGVDLTRANYAFYFSLGFSLGDYLQSLARLHRPGQEHHVHVYHLMAAGTVDEVVYKALDKRQKVVERVLEIYGGELCKTA